MIPVKTATAARILHFRSETDSSIRIALNSKKTGGLDSGLVEFGAILAWHQMPDFREFGAIILAWRQMLECVGDFDGHCSRGNAR